MTHKSRTLTPASVHVRVTTTNHLVVAAFIRGLGAYWMTFPPFTPEDEAVGRFLVVAKQVAQDYCPHDRFTYYYGPQVEECDDCGKRWA